MRSARQPSAGARAGARLRLALPLVVLAGINLATFRSHYLDGYGFPWDFLQAYYGTGAFSVSALAHGELPEWMPFQCMGYPYLLNPQTAFFYPPLWLFAALGVDYTLHAAVVVQCAHVLLGAVGVFFLLRRLGSSAQLALVGAVVYHFFGGFYCNAEHVDIIRAFALIPWVFHGSTLDPRQPATLGKGVLLLPLWLYLLATGGYPGNLIATTLAGAVYLPVQVADAIRRGASRQEALRAGAAVAGLAVAGFAMAAVHLGPIWLHRELFHRAATVAQLGYNNLWSVGLGTLVFSSRALPPQPDLSMTSTFISVPGFVLVWFALGRRLKERLPLTVVLVLASAMAGGPRSLVWRAAAAALPPVALSRFPISDYRPLIALGLIALAIVGLCAVARGEHTRRGIAVRSGLALLVLLHLARETYHSLSHPQVRWCLAVALATVLLLVGLRLRARPLGWTAAFAVIALVGIDALRVLPDMNSWRQPDIRAIYTQRGWTTETPWELARADGLEAKARTRPAREEVGHHNWFSWAGYLQMRYMMADRTPCLLAVAHEARRRGNYAAYMRREWAPLLVAGQGVEWTDAGPRLPPHAFRRASASGGEVRQVAYGLDEIHYVVELREPSLMIENEIHSPGWTATLDGPGDRRRITAVAVNEVFRGWQLPAGRYRMAARFHTPGLRPAAAMSLCGLAAWGTGAILLLRGGRRREREERSPEDL